MLASARWFGLLLPLLPLALLACGDADDPAPADAGRDAGRSADGSLPPDGGPFVDAGVDPDAGSVGPDGGQDAGGFDANVDPGGLPPDPASLALPYPAGVTSSFADGVRFLYSPGGPQYGADPRAFDPLRVSVLRGRVLDTNGQPLPLVRVESLLHPEMGYTRTRADGRFDLAVNGGDRSVLRFRLAGHVEAQRALEATFLDFSTIDDVVLTALDPQVTQVTLGAATLQVAEGSVVTDDDGARAAHVLFPAGTTALMVFADGSTAPLSTASVRATELTVGPRGPAAMPGLLPAQTAYTYAVELSVDEAIAADATEVRFSQPVYLHVDNFLGAPVGAAVPLGYYDRQRGYWVPAPDGRVIEVLGISGGLARVDVDGDGNADDEAAAALGIDEAERRALADRYPGGGSLWRSPVPHFTPWDCNWPYLLPEDADYPSSAGDGELDAEGRKHPCRESGSVLSCESQTLGEKIPLAGTPLRLVYSSARAMGRLSREGLNIPLTGASLPASVRSVVAEAEVGGRVFRETFAPAPELVWRLQWDRKDAFGREVSGLVSVRGRIGYVYEVTYAALGASSSSGQSFNTPAPAGTSFSRSEDLTATLWSPFARLLDAGGSGLDARTAGLGGFTLDEHHIYDPRRHGVAGGDGLEYAAPVDEGTRGRVIIAVGGRPNGRDPNIPGSVAEANLASPAELAPHPDGGYWLVTGGSRPIRRVDARGNLTTVGCTESELADGLCPPPEDGQPAAGRDITSWGFTVGSAPDGSLFYVSEDYRIWRIDAAGILHWVAGNGSDTMEPLLGQVGGSARDYAINPSSLRFDPSGGYLYFVHGDAEVYRVSPDGRLEHVAGLEDGSYTFSGEGGPATQATFRLIHDLALAADGELFLAHDGFNLANGVYRVGRDGVLVRYAGRGVSDPDCGSTISEGGVNRRELCFGQGGVRGIAFAPDGTLMAMSSAGRLYRLSEPAQVVARSAISTGAQPDFASAFQEVDFRPHMVSTAGGAFLVLVRDRIYDLVGLRVLRSINADDIFVPSPDAQEAWVFSPEGRHLSTHDMRTGAVRWMMGYGPHGLLETVTDAHGNVTTIERDSSGAPTAVVAPAGQRTTLGLDADGYLSSVETPDGRTFSIDWAGPADGQPAASGLLRAFTLPSGATSSFAYDEVGRLVSATNARGGVTTFTRSERFDGHVVTVTDPAGRVRTHTLRRLAAGDIERVVEQPTGATSSMVRSRDNRLVIQGEDGTRATLSFSADPRFGPQVMLPSEVQLRKGSRTTTGRLELYFDAPAGFFGTGRFSELLTVDGRTTTIVRDLEARTITRTTPAGRTQTIEYDDFGRVTGVSQGDGLESVTRAYDGRGLLETVGFGPYEWSFGYDTQSRLERVTDSGARAYEYAFDSGDRLTSLQQGGETVSFGYTADSELERFTMPNGGVHLMSYDPLGQMLSYTPPGNPAPYTSTVHPDGRLATTGLPSGRTQSYAYDTGGRLFSITAPEFTTTMSYAATTQLPAQVTRTPAAGPAQSLSYVHDADLLTELGFGGASSGSFSYTYSASLLLSGVATTVGATSFSHAISRNQDGLVTQYGPLGFTRGGPGGLVSAISNGAATHEFSYSPQAQLTRRALVTGGTTRFAVDLGYDASGLVSTRTENVAGVSTSFEYSHDAQGRLTRVVRGGTQVEAYAYDSNGNRVSATYGASAPVTSAYDVQDRITARGATAYTVDADGFVTGRGSDVFVWSSAGELLSATVASVTAQYDYDGLRRRVARRQGADTTRYLYGFPGDAFRVSASVAPDGTVSGYLYDESGYLVAVERGGSRFAIATDQVGSPRMVLDEGGSVIATFEYDAYGRPLASTGAFPLELGFAGGLRDAVTGLLRFGWRDYDPDAGRWMARDPIFLSGRQFNLYAYVRSSPVSYRDPSGLFCVGVSGYVGFGGGGSICVGSSGVSACGEIGVGVGDGVEVQPFAQPDHTTYIGAEVSAGAALGPIANIGAELKYGQYGNPYEDDIHCFKGGGALKGSLIGVEAGVDLDGKVTADKIDPTKGRDLRDLFKSRGPSNLINLEKKLEAKAVMKACGSVSNLF